MRFQDHLRRWWPAWLAAAIIAVAGWLGFSNETRGQLEEVEFRPEESAEADAETRPLTMVDFTSDRIQFFGKDLFFADTFDHAFPGLLGKKCAGTFISKKRFVTAAHCVREDVAIPIVTNDVQLGTVKAWCCRDSAWDHRKGLYCLGPGSQEVGDWAVCEIQGNLEVASWASISSAANARGEDIQLIYLSNKTEDLGTASATDVGDLCFPKGGGANGRSGSPVVVKDTGELLAIYSGFELGSSHLSSMVPADFDHLLNGTCRTIPRKP